MRRGAASSRRALATRWTLFRDIPHDHHTGEDNGLWPELLARLDATAGPDAAAGRAALAAMAAEHHDIDPLLDALALVQRHLSPADWERISETHFVRPKGVRATVAVLAWVMHELPGPAAARLLAGAGGCSCAGRSRGGNGVPSGVRDGTASTRRASALATIVCRMAVLLPGPTPRLQLWPGQNTCYAVESEGHNCNLDE